MEVSEMQAYLQSIETEVQQISETLRDQESEEVTAPPPVNVAIQTLRTIYRSLRLEQVSTTKSEGSEDYAGRAESSTYKSACRKLSRPEESLKEACCDFLKAYLDECRFSLESLSSDRDCAAPEDLES